MDDTQKAPGRVLDITATRDRVGNPCRATIYSWVKAGLFPRPIRVGPHRVGWVEAEIDAYLIKCRAQRDGK